MSNTVWAANPIISISMPESLSHVILKITLFTAMMKSTTERKKTKEVYTEGSEKMIYDDYLFTETEFKRTPEVAQAASRAKEKYVLSFSFSTSRFTNRRRCTIIRRLTSIYHSSRFGKVFDLTHVPVSMTLKQVEAQAREAHIESKHHLKGSEPRDGYA